MDTNRKIYWASTALLSILMVSSAFLFFFNNSEVSELFTKLGYPLYLIYILAVLKLLGITAILTNASQILRELAYAGFFFNLIFAFTAHAMAEEYGFTPSIFGLSFLIVSYIFDKRRRVSR